MSDRLLPRCEICGIPFSQMAITCDCVHRQDPAFYVYEQGSECVWEVDGNPYYVVRCGEMRIHYKKDDHEEVIRYTEQLDALGIDTDQKLQDIYKELGDEGFYWDNNSWFEVHSNEDPDFYTDAIHELDNAVLNAIRLGQGKEPIWV
jgi:hypothetical protein